MGVWESGGGREGVGARACGRAGGRARVRTQVAVAGGRWQAERVREGRRVAMAGVRGGGGVGRKKQQGSQNRWCFTQHPCFC